MAPKGKMAMQMDEKVAHQVGGMQHAMKPMAGGKMTRASSKLSGKLKMHKGKKH